MSVHLAAPISRFFLWFRSFRPFSWPASVIPILLGTSLAYLFGYGFNPFGAVLALTGGVLLHAIANIFNSYYDWINELDRPGDPQVIPALTEPGLGPPAVLRCGYLLMIATLVLTLVASTIFGWPMAVFCAVGLSGGYFYTAPPIAYKYRGWSLPAVFLLMGPLLTLAAFYLQTKAMSLNATLLSLPIAFLVTAVLQANELRDLELDRKQNVRTLAVRFSWRFGLLMYGLLLLFPHLTVVALWMFGLVGSHSLFALLLAGKAFALFRQAHNGDFLDLDVRTACYHAIFGASYIVSLLLQ